MGLRTTVVLHPGEQFMGGDRNGKRTIRRAVCCVVVATSSSTYYYCDHGKHDSVCLDVDTLILRGRGNYECTR